MTPALNSERGSHLDPLLRGVEVRLGPDGEPIDFEVQARRLFCAEDAAGLLPALVDPTRLHGGRLTLLGGLGPDEALRRGLAGYCPRDLGAASSLTVWQVLTRSARLIDVPSSEVERVLEACHLSRARKKRISRLNRRELRLLSLAHGLCGDPRLLIVEDLLSDLDDHDAEEISMLLEEVLSEKRWILAGTPESRLSRRWFRTAGAILHGRGGTLSGPVPPAMLRADAHWVITYESADRLASQLRADGVDVSLSPNPHAALVFAETDVILAAAAESGMKIVDLSPTGSGPIQAMRARSKP